MTKFGFTDEDDALLTELGIEVKTENAADRTPREERIIAGFEEIQRFVKQHKRLPSVAEDHDIFERIYATRLAQIHRQPECRGILNGRDPQGLLDATEPMAACSNEELSDEELLAKLDVAAPATDISHLRHVAPRAALRAAEEITHRSPCKDFDKFKPIFAAVQHEMDTGVREVQTFRKNAGFLKADIKQGDFFILGGQIAYVAEVGKPITAPNGESDARLRVIYDNGTENALLLRSMQRALYKDKTSRIISEPDAGPLFSDTVDEEEDLASGTVYILRSKSDHPQVSAHRKLIHKIGVTSGDVTRRIANASHDPTFLLAEVEIVATYELFNINRTRLEKIIHTFFEPVRLEIQIIDRFGQPVVPKEWFLVPLHAVDEAVEKIKTGTLGGYIYDAESASLKARQGSQPG